MSDVWATTGCVPGLKVRLTAEELAGHLRARADYHAQRRDEKKAQVPKLEEATAAIKAQSPIAVVAQFSKSASNYRFDGDDAVAQLKADIESHHNRAVAFLWLSDHLFPQVYCLGREELIELEILKR